MNTSKTLQFKDFEYQRPDMDKINEGFQTALKSFNEAQNIEQAQSALQAIYALRSSFDSMYNLCYVRHSINTKDEFYEAENSFFDQQLPHFSQLKTEWYKSLLASNFASELSEIYGQQLFDIARLSIKTMSVEIIEDLQEENRLSTAYNKLKATAQIEFEGQQYNLSSIIPLEQAADRATRSAASAAKWNWLQNKQAEIEDIFDQLVKVRHRIAQKLGFDNFVELGYARMLRTDYSAKEVAFYRQEVRKHIVPIAQKLYQQQQERLGLDQLYYYDENLLFPTGNPSPKGDAAWIIEQAKQMYHELSADTAEFFDFMQDSGLMDLESRDGKSTGGYCTFIPAFKAPFIFSNFNGTSGDIDVLTHEAGHAFQIYSSRNLAIDEYYWPTYEACEIHSMSMEFFTWPWMHLFFKEDVKDYHYGHLARAIYFLPYGVAVDEFQHYVYENPTASPSERNAYWKQLEEQYLPQRNYGGQPYLEQGTFWQRQTHIFAMPFYYIDYTLAQVCAFQFWVKDRADHQSAWKDYVRLCNAGGSQSFLDLVKLAQLSSPFEAGTLARLGKKVAVYLQE